MAYEPLYLHRERRERGNIDPAEQAQEHPGHKLVALGLECGSPQEPGDMIEEASTAREERVRPFARDRKARQMRVQPPPGGTA